MIYNYKMEVNIEKENIIIILIFYHLLLEKNPEVAKKKENTQKLTD